MKKIKTILLLVATFTYTAHASEFLILHWETRTATANCEANELSRVITEIIEVPTYTQSVKSAAARQFLDYAYENHKETLDTIAGHTRFGFMGVVRASTVEEVKELAERKGIYSKSGWCSGERRDVWNIHVLDAPDFKMGAHCEFVSYERWQFLNAYLEKGP